MPSSQNSRRNLSESSLHLGIWKKKQKKTSWIFCNMILRLSPLSRCYLQMNVTSEKLDRMPRLLPRFFSLGGIKVPGAWQMYMRILSDLPPLWVLFVWSCAMIPVLGKVDLDSCEKINAVMFVFVPQFTGTSAIWLGFATRFFCWLCIMVGRSGLNHHSGSNIFTLSNYLKQM